MSVRFAFVLAALAATHVACSGADAEPLGDEQDIKRAHAGEEGGTCGGIAGILCKAGLSCKLEGSHPDATGKCEKSAPPSKPSGLGEPCGDDVAIQRKCAEGLSCILPTTGPISEHTAGTCQKPAAALDGHWGADGANMTIEKGVARIELGCGSASIDDFVATGATTFTGTGTHTQGTGVRPLPGHEPRPEPATFKATLSGEKLKIEMTLDGRKSTMTFTKDRHVDLIRCL